ncbi:MAG: dephospho-CoA kinase [Muribaculaceae bacterium]|nr:dephospho-CoA kinase [Muribaculaceae bacterium]
MKRIVAITGGIGAGKSVVCHALGAMGFPVYDCDSQARAIMDNDCDIKARIAAEITPQALGGDNSLNRKAIAACVFSDPEKLKRLNAIVHAAVRDHFASWASAQKSPLVFVETAILYESGFDRLVNEIWEVTAPTEIRIDRVMRRSGLSRDEIERRIASQAPTVNPAHRIIVNDDLTPMISQLLQLLDDNNDPA